MPSHVILNGARSAELKDLGGGSPKDPCPQIPPLAGPLRGLLGRDDTRRDWWAGTGGRPSAFRRNPIDQGIDIHARPHRSQDEDVPG
jgi:hypothetical protein